MALLDSKQLNPKLTGSFILSGSTQTFIGASDFQGSITASGDISASGTVFADTFQSTGGDVDGISFTDDLNITGNITASGNISASGIFTAEGLVVSDDANITDNLTVGGDLDISDTIYHTGDSNTKIRFPEVDTITFHTSGNERMRISAGGQITASGNFEVTGNISGSITSTGSFGHLKLGNVDTDASFEFGKVHIGHIGFSDMAGFSHVDNDSTSNFAIAQSAAGKTIINAKSGQPIAFKINNTDKVQINSSGDLGVGIETALHKLHVVGDGFFTGNVSGSSTSTGSFGSLEIDGLRLAYSAEEGKHQFSAPILTTQGTFSAPGIGIGDSDTGFYDSGANLFGVTAGGTPIIEYSANAQTMAPGKHIILQGTGNVSGSSTSTGSFGRVELGQSNSAPMAVYGNAATAGIRLENYKGYL